MFTTNVIINAIPPPRNIHESKQILAALQKFGEVTTFRNLKYDLSNGSEFTHRSILAIFATREAANNAIASSPLSIPLPKPTAITPPISQIAYKSRHSESEPPTTLSLTIRSSRHNHESATVRNPWFAKNYNPHPTDPIFQDMLNQENGLPIRQLADILQSAKSVKPGNRIVYERFSMLKVWKEGMKDIKDQHQDQSIDETHETQAHATSFYTREESRLQQLPNEEPSKLLKETDIYVPFQKKKSST